MLNNDLRNDAVSNFESAKDIYEMLADDVRTQSEKLMNVRKKECHRTIIEVEEMFSKVANTPKVFDKAFAEYKAEFKVFTDILNDIREDVRRANLQTSGTAGAGLMAGAGVATLAPTAAMAIATTFGTASTGTAISSLAGAAATRSALAWLGGGALAAGGGGMAAGNALLALAGPVGWGISGATLAGSALLARRKNAKIAEEANEKRKEIEVLNRQFKASLVEVKKLIIETREHRYGMIKQLKELKRDMTSFDYKMLDSEQKNKMISLKNHVESLSALMNKKIDV
ncbi:hypothetical protein ACQKCW_07345 [Psychrobacter pacificensis]|uniref:hypothetical protein n=1 Tax=Psychrobacter pacificensis TaxID=112002 RepID=UPI003CFD1AA6